MGELLVLRYANNLTQASFSRSPFERGRMLSFRQTSKLSKNWRRTSVFADGSKKRARRNYKQAGITERRSRASNSNAKVKSKHGVKARWKKCSRNLVTWKKVAAMCT